MARDPHTERLVQMTLKARSDLEQEDCSRPDPGRGTSERELSKFSANSLESLAHRLSTTKAEPRYGRVNVGWIDIDPNDSARTVTFLRALAQRLRPYGIEFNSQGSKTEFAKDDSSVHFAIRSPKTRTSTPKYPYHRNEHAFTGRLTLEIYGQTRGTKKNWTFERNDQPVDHLEEIITVFRLSLAVQKMIDEERRKAAEHVAHLAFRKDLAKRRREREHDRREFLHSVGNARREIEDLDATIALLRSKPSRGPDLNRMLAWAEGRVADLAKLTDAESLGKILEENKLFPEPDGLFDPDGMEDDELLLSSSSRLSDHLKQ